jgi:hypothetical protein
VTEKFKRHWSFIVCDKKYLYPLVILLLILGIGTSIIFNDATHINRVGNFIVCVGVWMSLRFALREGINKHKNAQDASPTIPGSGRAQQLNPAYFNDITFSIGDAKLQIQGFGIVIFGSVLGSYGDIIFSLFYDFKNHVN